jgi:type IV secretory pathway TraG/TraD family ATPase VirD4
MHSGKGPLFKRLFYWFIGHRFVCFTSIVFLLFETPTYIHTSIPLYRCQTNISYGLLCAHHLNIEFRELREVYIKKWDALSISPWVIQVIESWCYGDRVYLRNILVISVIILRIMTLSYIFCYRSIDSLQKYEDRR